MARATGDVVRSAVGIDRRKPDAASRDFFSASIRAPRRRVAARVGVGSRRRCAHGPGGRTSGDAPARPRRGRHRRRPRERGRRARPRPRVASRRDAATLPRQAYVRPDLAVSVGAPASEAHEPKRRRPAPARRRRFSRRAAQSERGRGAAPHLRSSPPRGRPRVVRRQSSRRAARPERGPVDDVLRARSPTPASGATPRCFRRRPSAPRPSCSVRTRGRGRPRRRRRP